MQSDPIYQREISALSLERDSELRAEGLLHLASRQESRGREDLALEIYSRLGNAESPDYSATVAARAARRAHALLGNGDFGERFEIFQRNFFRQASDPALLFGMAVAGGLGSTLRFGAMARLSAAPAAAWTRGLGARSLASAGALALEAPAFTAATRLARSALGSRSQDAGWPREMLSAYLLLGALRFSGGATGLLSEGLALRPWTAGLLQQGGQLGGLMLVHRAEVAAGWRPESSATHALADSLGILLLFHVSGRLSSSLLGPRFAAWNQSMELRSRAMNALQPPRHLSSLFPEPAFAAFGPARSLRFPKEAPLAPTILQMSAASHGERPGGEFRPPMASGDFKIQDEPSAVRLSVEQLIRRSDEEFFEPELMESLLSQKRAFSDFDRNRVEQGLRLYLNEEGIPSYALQSEHVRHRLGEVWQNSRNPGAPLSREAQATLEEIQAARIFLRDFRFSDGSQFASSPFQRSPGISQAIGRDFYYLNDAGRSTGSFKERGALIEVRRAAGRGALHVVAASHGNHGLAVALAALKLGLRSSIVVPDTTPQVKIERLRELGATVIRTGEQPWRGYEEARDWALRYVLERNIYLHNRMELEGVTRYIHGFEDVIAGQGVAGYEILEAIRNLPEGQRESLARAVFLVPTGGGGLAAGLATVLKSELPEARVIGVVSEEAPAMHVSLIDGKRSEVFLNEKGLCDSGIGLTIPGARPFRLLTELLDGSLPVGDPLVAEAMRMIYRHEGLKVEGGAATGLAAILGGRLAELGIAPQTPVVTVLTGGNIDASRHAEVMAGQP